STTWKRSSPLRQIRQFRTPAPLSASTSSGGMFAWASAYSSSVPGLSRVWRAMLSVIEIPRLQEQFKYGQCDVGPLDRELDGQRPGWLAAGSDVDGLLSGALSL